MFYVQLDLCPDLVAQAQMWDGKTEVDPVGRYLEQAHAEREQAQAEGEMDADEYLAAQARKEAAEAGPLLFSMEMVPARSINFAPNSQEAELFKQKVKEAFEAVNKPKKAHLFTVCSYPEVLNLIRPFDGQVIIRWDNLEKLHSKHYIPVEKISELPWSISDPIAVFEDFGDKKELIVVTEIEAPTRESMERYNSSGDSSDIVIRKVAAALRFRHDKMKQVEVVDMVSAYSRDKSDKYTGLLKNNRLLYLDKQRAEEWANMEEHTMSQLLSTMLPNLGSEVILKENLEFVNSNFSANQERNLAAVHSLSPEKFLGALELGGMPMPSVAITRLDRPYGWGSAGNIVLVGRPALVDPKTGAEVYSRDAWTGNFPRVVHKVIGKKDRSDSVSDLHDMRTKYQATGDYNSDIHQLDYRINMDYGGEQTSRSDMDYGLRQRTGKALFAWQSGYQPRPKTKDATRVHEWLTKEVASRLRRYVSLSPDEYHEKWPEIKEEVRQEIEKVYRESSVIKKAPTPEAAEKRLTSWVNVALRAFDAYSPSALEKELEDVKKIGARVLDIEANLDMLAKYADKHKKAYEEWIVQKLNAWFSKERF